MSLKAVIQRFLLVPGYSGRKNDIIYSKCNAELQPESQVVYFGGDVQDYLENMKTHRDNHRYVKWDLEATASILAYSFPKSEILVVKPSRMYLRTFSCYDNFVESNQTGVPLHTPNWGANKHLVELIRNANKLAIDGEKSSNDLPGDCNSDKLPLVLIGFSKGCVVLNQLVYEMHQSGDQPEMKEFISRVNAMYWLDGGHAGGSKVWITDSATLKSLANTGILLHIHVTPYQMEDDQRPWIRKEEKLFTECLHKMKANITRKLHFAGEVPSIDLHFKILESFHKVS